MVVDLLEPRGFGGVGGCCFGFWFRLIGSGDGGDRIWVGARVVIRGGVAGCNTGFRALRGFGDKTTGDDWVIGGGGVNGRGFGLSVGLGLGFNVRSVVGGGSGTSAILSLELAGDLAGDLLGDARLTGSPALACSNIEMRDPIGASDPESTTSPPLDELVAPTLVLLRGVLTFGVGLAFLLAASVAAMKLALFGSAFVPVYPGCSCDGLAPTWCILDTVMPPYWSMSAMLPPVLWARRCFTGLRGLPADVAAVRAPLSFFGGGGAGFFFWKARDAPWRAVVAGSVEPGAWDAMGFIAGGSGERQDDMAGPGWRWRAKCGFLKRGRESATSRELGSRM